MYRKDIDKWIKHGEFLLPDLHWMQAAYIFSCIARNGWGNPYEDEVYLNIGIIICLADICTAFFMETYSGIMRRGHFWEFKNVLQHVAVVAAPSTEIEAVVKQILLQSYHEIEIVGIVLTDREEYEETNIQSIPVVCTMDKIPEYIQTRWIDCVLIHLTQPIAISERIINTCVEMGVTVHYRLSVLEKITGARQIERVAGYEELRRKGNATCVYSWFQVFRGLRWV